MSDLFVALIPVLCPALAVVLMSGVLVWCDMPLHCLVMMAAGTPFVFRGILVSRETLHQPPATQEG